jgi:hypothetical protein
VFLGSGLLFLAMLLAAAALAGSLVESVHQNSALAARNLGCRTALDQCADERLRDANGRRVHDLNLDASCHKADSCPACSRYPATRSQPRS